MKPMIKTRWWLWSLGFGINRGQFTTYACGQCEGDPTEVYLHLGPFELFWCTGYWMKRHKSNQRYSDNWL
jgi:hypothetical protein